MEPKQQRIYHSTIDAAVKKNTKPLTNKMFPFKNTLSSQYIFYRYKPQSTREHYYPFIHRPIYSNNYINKFNANITNLTEKIAPKLNITEYLSKFCPQHYSTK